MSPPGVRIRGLRKRFGDTVALDGLDLDAPVGEILGVAGPNGAGKSTMVKILAGEVTADAGEITVAGEPWSPQVSGHRIAIVHQEPQLFPNLTVEENLLVGQEVMRRGRPTATEADHELMSELGILSLRGEAVGRLPLAVQQKTEIGRALRRRADVFLFDEPNSALTESESADLFDRMHRLAVSGRVVLLVSHRLAELAAHATRVCVIKDGRLDTVLDAERVTAERIARELVVTASTSGNGTRGSRARSGERHPLLSVRDWTHRHARFRDIDMTVHRGEIVAVVGVEGSGGREFVRSLAGVEPAHGEVVLDDGSRGAAATARTAFVAADRADSLFANLTVEENLVLRRHASVTGPLGWRRRRVAQAFAARARGEFMVKAPRLDAPIQALSGGNQQKVAIAAALSVDPTVAVLEEPTRGVDVASKSEIYQLLRAYVTRGRAAVLYCTEDSEVFDVADRVLVIARGRVVDIVGVHAFHDAESLAERLAALAAGSNGRSAAAAG